MTVSILGYYNTNWGRFLVTSTHNYHNHVTYVLVINVNKLHCILGFIHWYKYFAVSFQWCIFYDRKIFILHMNLSKKIQNSKIIATQIRPNTENSETIT